MSSARSQDIRPINRNQLYFYSEMTALYHIFLTKIWINSNFLSYPSVELQNFFQGDCAEACYLFTCYCKYIPFLILLVLMFICIKNYLYMLTL